MFPALSGCRRRVLFFCCFWAISLFLLLRMKSSSDSTSNPPESSQKCQTISSHQTVLVDKNGTTHAYDRSSPIIFIGGFPRSGTTLVRSMLDAHSAIRCGEETRVIPRILGLASQWNRSTKESNRLHEAGLSDEIIADAVAAFILEVVVKHGEPAARLCNKDPFSLKYGRFLLKLFPQGKLIFMIRDGRAVVHSVISRKVTITGFDLTDYRQCLTKWSNSVTVMLRECDELGETKCLKVKYEDLVLHPKPQMERILKYLNLPWENSVLHHEQYVNKPGGVSLSKLERSTDQVVKPVNADALSKWVGAIPDDVVHDMDTIAPMLEKLGYDPKANPPKYGAPDQPQDVTNNI